MSCACGQNTNIIYFRINLKIKKIKKKAFQPYSSVVVVFVVTVSVVPTLLTSILLPVNS